MKSAEGWEEELIGAVEYDHDNPSNKSTNVRAVIRKIQLDAGAHWRQYAAHLPTCASFYPESQCDCGLDDAINQLSKTAKE